MNGKCLKTNTFTTEQSKKDWKETPTQKMTQTIGPKGEMKKGEMKREPHSHWDHGQTQTDNMNFATTSDIGPTPQTMSSPYGNTTHIGKTTQSNEPSHDKRSHPKNL